jgi:hypothetical protein
MKTDIISESKLEVVANKISSSQFNAGSELINNDIFGKYLKYYLILTDNIDLIIPLIDSTEEELFKSRYFYFIKFYKLYILQNGDNEGLYQMFMMFLEEIPVKVKWEQLKLIEDEIDFGLNYLNVQIPRILQV